MMYLLDVNALIALGVVQHVHHARVAGWLRSLRMASRERVRLATCSITETGFVRVTSGRSALLPNVLRARSELLRLKSTEALLFLDDTVGVEYLPEWVTKSAQVTDGHLLQLARSYGAQLATLDTGIPEADLIVDASEIRDSVSPVSYGNAYPPAAPSRPLILN